MYTGIQVHVGSALEGDLFQASGTLYPCSTDTYIIYNVYNGQFRLSQRKIFLLKLTCLIQTPVSACKAHFSLSRVTLPYTCIINPASRTLVCYWLIVYD